MLSYVSLSSATLIFLLLSHNIRFFSYGHRGDRFLYLYRKERRSHHDDKYNSQHDEHGNHHLRPCFLPQLFCQILSVLKCFLRFS
ncbi:DUF3899 domain-containing protein [Mediterraneibacter glycyrrhizinilyticus]|nr:DUF3899 domain-containing protein [Mediterraneibacter glycyrrhizinilyticus]